MCYCDGRLGRTSFLESAWGNFCRLRLHSVSMRGVGAGARQCDTEHDEKKDPIQSFF